MQYFFILGRNPELSLAELYAILPDGYKTLAKSDQVLIVDCSELSVPSLIKRLGGTIKIGLISKNKPLELINTQSDRKIIFGLSAYSLKNRLPNLRTLRSLGIEMKRELQKKGHRVRLVTSKQPALSSVIVEKEGLLSSGGEIVLFDKSYIGKTLAVQEFEQASKRDYGRPVRGMKVGMLPIQLAKIMINLARAPKSATILDPFCGFGTILSEALLMGYNNIIGSDIEQKMVGGAEKNLQWLQKGCKVKLFRSAVEEFSKYLKPRSIDTIVTEPYLGPTRQAGNKESELIELYTHTFEQFVKVLKRDGKVVFIFPAFKQRNKITKTSEKVLPKIKKLGFKPAISPITYSRENQKVLREIFVFEFR